MNCVMLSLPESVTLDMNTDCSSAENDLFGSPEYVAQCPKS